MLSALYSILATIYSDDKNVAVFLGRPPRLSRTFCCFQLPDLPSSRQDNTGTLADQGASVSTGQRAPFFATHESITLDTSIRWAASCACLKEKALELIHATDTAETKKQRIG
jgi:hypothetical protein